MRKLLLLWLVLLSCFAGDGAFATSSKPLVIIGGQTKQIPDANTLQVGSLGGGGAQCLHTDNSGVITGLGSDCSSGSAVAFHPGFATGQYYTTPFYSGGTQSVSTGFIYAVPFYSPGSVTFTKADVRLTANSSITKATVAFFANSSGLPAALESSCEITGISSTGTFEATGCTLTLTAGWHWLGVGYNGSGTSVSNQATGQTATSWLLGFSSSSFPTESGVNASWSYVSGSPPNPFGTVSYQTGQTPVAFVRF